MDPGVVSGVLVVAGVTLGMVVSLGAVLHAGALARFIRRWSERRNGVAQAPPRSRPIEVIAVNARRLRSQFRQVPSGTPFARREGLRLAYDEVLAEGCRALEVECRLDVLPPGLDRDVERLRVEHLLGEAGLGLDEAA